MALRLLKDWHCDCFGSEETPWISVRAGHFLETLHGFDKLFGSLGPQLARPLRVALFSLNQVYMVHCIRRVVRRALLAGEAPRNRQKP